MSATIYLHIANCEKCKLDALLRHGARYLPASYIYKARTYKQEADACRFLLGKMLLLKGMQQLHSATWSLDFLECDTYKKPYSKGNVFFNTTHSGNYVLCAFSKDCRLGIDIESIGAISFEHFLSCFTPTEWQYIMGATDPLKQFYTYWTKKEAVIKADGRGLHLPLQSFTVLDNAAYIDGYQWHLQELNINSGYCAHIATSRCIDADTDIQYIMHAAATWV
jgi:4'-phosphopantetheinyl transferase